MTEPKFAFFYDVNRMMGWNKDDGPYWHGTGSTVEERLYEAIEGMAELHARLADMEAKLPDEPRADGWQPIETAPGLPVLVTRPTDRYVFIPTTAFRDATGAWRLYRSPGGNMRLPFTPTHWMPIPEPPEVSRG